jgi:hypothetical protein
MNKVKLVNQDRLGEFGFRKGVTDGLWSKPLNSSRGAYYLLYDEEAQKVGIEFIGLSTEMEMTIEDGLNKLGFRNQESADSVRALLECMELEEVLVYERSNIV